MSTLHDVGLYVPVRDGRRTLAPCLDAIAALDPAPARTLVVDDGSRDGSSRIAHARDVPVLRQAPRGLAAARNAGWRALETRWVACLDADCAPAPDWLGRLVHALERAPPELAGAGGRLVESGARLADRWRARWLAQDWGPSPGHVPFLFGANGVLARSALERVGGYDERFRTNAEDYWLGQALATAGYAVLHVPAARVVHLRRDRVTSVLRNHWKHRFYGHRHALGWRACAHSAITAARSSASMVAQDLAAGRTELLGLDLALPSLAIARDLAATWRGHA